VSAVRAEILLATYNGEKYLREQLDSILSQDDDRWHLTVSDDGSSDGTCAILDEYAAKYPDQITHVRSGKRFGCARDHFMHLMRQCPAEYMLFCDQDDVWYPEKLRLSLGALQKLEWESGREIPLLVFTDQAAVDQDLRVIHPSMTAYQRRPVHCLDWRSLLMQNVVNGCTMAFNRALADMAAKCPDDAMLPMHDGWLAVIAARFGRIHYIDQATMGYRQHGRNSVGAENVRSAGYVLGRMSKIDQLRKAIQDKKKQAEVFRKTFLVQLDRKDEAFLRAFEKPCSGPAFYLSHWRLIHSIFHLAGFCLLG